MKKLVAIAAGLLLAGQSTLALAAPDGAVAPKAPTAHVRAVNACNLQQHALVKSDKAWARVANRCDYSAKEYDEPSWFWPAIGLGAVALGVGIYYATKSTSP